ncbi:U3 small nucleolar RNA-associated protein 4 homolog [Tubulanus polymorphus]|uniref:U3 small nucleolar RNA-associated protein 4 homolog n=1 Tax=Tubulanus polymorphus TaxID=672921 RepID=UPI003DA3AE43
MAEFKVHQVRFFEYTPHAIHCLAYDENKKRIALSRSNGSIEIWSIPDNWFLQKVIPSCEGRSVEALVWSAGRLFSAGLQGEIIEYDLMKLCPKQSVPSYSGAVWCLTVNTSGTLLAAGTEDGCVALFDIISDSLQYSKSFDRIDSRILCIAWNDTEDRIVTGGMENIRVWSVESGHAIQRLTVGRIDPRKETIIWCVAVTKDMTIISGDSRGKTSFWNGKMGTKIKSFQSHQADVLTLCINKDGDSVFCSGIDSSLVQFEYIKTKDDSDWKTWVNSKMRLQNPHTHDVRALVHTGEFLVSGGVDCNLIYLPFKGKIDGKYKKVPAIPQNVVHIAAADASVLLQYSNYLELWKLGSTNKTSNRNGDILPLTTNPIKLLQLKSRDAETIVCSALSTCGKWIAYSDLYSVRLYHVTLEESDTINVSLHRVRYQHPDVLPAHRLVFNNDSTKLISAANNGTVQVISVDKIQPSLICTMQPSTESEPNECIHLLAINNDGTRVAAADHQRNVYVYDLDAKKYLCKLPNYHVQPTALSFLPDTTILTVAYCDRKVLEYDYEKRQYTDWCKEHIAQFPHDWIHRQNKLLNLFNNHSNQNQFIVHDDQQLAILDKSKPFLSKTKSSPKTKTKQSKVNRAIHICNKYKYLVHVGSLRDGSLVVTEVTPMALLDSLPPTLRQKKFGT